MQFLILSFEAQKSLTTKPDDTVSCETATLGAVKQKEEKTQPPTLICSLSQNAMFYTWHEVIQVIFNYYI